MDGQKSGIAIEGLGQDLAWCSRCGCGPVNSRGDRITGPQCRCLICGAELRVERAADGHLVSVGWRIPRPAPRTPKKADV